MMTLIAQKSRTVAREFAKLNNGKVVDKGADNAEGRWFVEVEVQEAATINDALKAVFADKAQEGVPGFRRVLTVKGGSRTNPKQKKVKLLRQANGKQVEVIERRSMRDYLPEIA